MEDTSFIRLIAPEDIIQSFELVEFKEKSNCFELYFEEKKELIPSILYGQDVILDGFCNPLSLLSFPIKAMSTYLIIKRRRWKIKGNNKHYSNEYNFNHTGVKATKEFAAFLKDVYGHTPDEYLRICRTIRG